jgi:putative SOS response-associated peptidase YedK
MPVILSPGHYDAWIDPKFQDADRLKSMLKPFPAEAMSATIVSTWVSNARNEGERCIEPASSGLLL